MRACLNCGRGTNHQHRALRAHQRLISIRSSSDEGPEPQVDMRDGAENVDGAVEDEMFDDKSETLPVKVALWMLHFYKTGISPLMPPSCRFQPTCSSYAVDAYTRYGVTKGTIMTAWRLFRCTPWGDRGYDPAIWPPKGLHFLKEL